MVIKLLELTNSHRQIYQFTLILYGFGVSCNGDIFELNARTLSIYREVYVYIKKIISI